MLFVTNVGSRPPGPGFVCTFSAISRTCGYCVGVGLVGEIQEGEGTRHRARRRRSSRRRTPPRRSRAPRTPARGRRSSEARWSCRRPPRALVAARLREVATVEAAEGRGDLGLVVGVNELDALAMGEPMVGGVEVSPLIEHRLIGLVVDHRAQAVLVGQGEVEDLQLDGQGALLAVGGHRHRSAVDPGGKVAPGVDLDPEGLVAVPATRRGNPPRPARAFSGTRTTGFHPVGSRGAAALPGFQAHSARVSCVTWR